VDPTWAACEAFVCLAGLFDDVAGWVVGDVVVDVSAGALGEPPSNRNPAAASKATNVAAATRTPAVRRPRRGSPTYGSSSHGG
jgi:hypothetical protein